MTRKKIYTGSIQITLLRVFSSLCLFHSMYEEHMNLQCCLGLLIIVKNCLIHTSNLSISSLGLSLYKLSVMAIISIPME